MSEWVQGWCHTGCRTWLPSWVPVWVQFCLSFSLSKQGPIHTFTPSAVSWLKPPPSSGRSRWPRYLTQAYWHNHCGTLAFLGGYASLNLLLFTLAALQHASLSGWVAVARGCGQCLNFNCALLAVSAGSQEGC